MYTTQFIAQQKISVDQHEFTNLRYFSQYVSEEIDTQYQVNTVYLDFQVSFDQIDHSPSSWVAQAFILGISVPLRCI